MTGVLETDAFSTFVIVLYFIVNMIYMVFFETNVIYAIVLSEIVSYEIFNFDLFLNVEFKVSIFNIMI